MLVFGGLSLRRRAGLCFRWVVSDTHDYFLPRPGRLSSKSGADMIISCGDLRLVGSARQCPTLAVWALLLGGVVFQRLHQISYPVRLVFSLLHRWGGVPKSCLRIPAPRWGGVPKVGVVLQKGVPESPLCILLPAPPSLSMPLTYNVYNDGTHTHKMAC